VTPRIYALLATLAAAIGLASSMVTAKFFVLGLERMEPDDAARDLLIAAGILMIVVELAAFGLAALLPQKTLIALRWRLMACAMLLLAFEGATIYATQLVLSGNAQSSATAHSTKVTSLQAAIASQRAAINALRTNGEAQSQSTSAWTRQVGAAALRDAMLAEKQLAPLANQLAELQSTARPTLSSVLGPQAMMAYSIARSLLLSIMGLVMFGAAGTLLRAGYYSPAPTTEHNHTADLSAPIKHKPNYSNAITSPAMRFAAAVPLAIAAMASVAQAAPTTASATAPAEPASPAADARYERLRAGVASGAIKPSVRGLQTHERMGTRAACTYLLQLASEGLIQRAGRGWAITTPIHNTTSLF